MVNPRHIWAVGHALRVTTLLYCAALFLFLREWLSIVLRVVETVTGALEIDLTPITFHALVFPFVLLPIFAFAATFLAGIGLLRHWRQLGRLARFTSILAIIAITGLGLMASAYALLMFFVPGVDIRP